MLQLIKDFHGFLLGEIFTEGFHQQVVIDTDSPIIGVETGKPIDEITGIFIEHEYLEWLSKQHILDESRLVDGS